MSHPSSRRAFGAATVAIVLISAVVALALVHGRSGPRVTARTVDGAAETVGGASEMNAADRRAIAQFVDDGGDRLATSTIRFSLYLPTYAAAVRSGADIAAAGYSYSIENPLGNLATGIVAKDWLVLARTQGPLSDDLVGAARKTFTAIAATYGGEYDGWEAAPSEH